MNVWNFTIDGIGVTDKFKKLAAIGFGFIIFGVVICLIALAILLAFLFILLAPFLLLIGAVGLILLISGAIMLEIIYHMQRKQKVNSVSFKVEK